MSALARKNEFNSCSLTVMFSLHRSNGPGKGGFPGLDRSWASKGQAEPGFTFSGLVGPSVPFFVPCGDFGLSTVLNSCDRKAADWSATACLAPVPIAAYHRGKVV